ncbi:hypothetical protein ANO11243_040310 [Dothideomycetidae sp. 11243]|nr:hypothetical protein ANO11243_040310 [fungal sp. No.11243]
MKPVQAMHYLQPLLALSSVAFASQSNLSPSRPVTSSPDVCAIDPKALVSDACISYANLNELNDLVHGYVRSIVRQTDFFSYYRLNLYNKKCPFWSDENGMCGNVACAVTTLENEADIPPIWRAEELSKLEGPHAHHPDKKEQKEHPDSPLQGELGIGVGESCVVEYDDECDERDYCVPEDESASAKGDYVSLVDNPERFTGYAGQGAHQVWDAIYRENCFSKRQESSKSSNAAASFGFGGAKLSGQPAQAAMDLKNVMRDHGRQQAMQTGGIEDSMEFDDECVERRVFYRVVSGMHASISTHLCYDYLNQTTGRWSPNLQCYKERLHGHPERISNLYFNYALVLRAVGKLKDHIQDYTFCTGDPLEDARTKHMVQSLAAALPAGPELFDESILFQDTQAFGSGIALKEDFKARFRNISRIMDCVGCDKCRLWGKLQTSGYGTALKVLFEFGHGDEGSAKPLLRRTELVALINTLDKISHAIKAINKFQDMMTQERPAASSASDRNSDSEPGAPKAEKKKPANEEESISDVFWEEWHRVWAAYKMVISGWINLPGVLWSITLEELSRVYNYWIGLPIPPRSWEIRIPSPDEL